MSEYCFQPVKPSFRMSAEQIADWFLDIHQNWFCEPSNTLFGNRNACHMALVMYLQGTPLFLPTPNQSYVVAQFKAECESWFKRQSQRLWDVYLEPYSGEITEVVKDAFLVRDAVGIIFNGVVLRTKDRAIEEIVADYNRQLASKRY